MLLAVEKLPDGKQLPPFNLGNEGRVTIREVAETIISISGKPIKIEWDTAHPTAIWGQAFDCALARQLLNGWHPRVSLRQGLEACYQHIESRLSS